MKPPNTQAYSLGMEWSKSFIFKSVEINKNLQLENNRKIPLKEMKRVWIFLYIQTV